jgi:L-lactate dehydrogenase (cytochrome)
MVTKEELAKHATRDDCWVAILGQVYDLTSFLAEHPGGADILLKFAGKDATKAFSSMHPPTFLNQLPASVLKGPLDGWQPPEAPVAKPKELPPIDSLINARDFEAVAEKAMEPQGWTYYSTGSEDERTFRENETAYSHWWFRPRVLVDVSHVDTSTTILGANSSFPFFLSASAMAGMAHPEAEVALARACHVAGVPQMVPTLSSRTLEDIAAARKEGQTQWLQLYVNPDRRKAWDMLKRAEDLGFSGVFLTVDTPYTGRRERDLRNKFLSGKSVIKSLGTFSDPSMAWDFTDELASRTKMPIVLKGIQRGEDAALALQHPVKGILISNHGGRQLDGARPTLEVLEEVCAALGSDPKLEIYVDGGIRRGSDIVKALALGATAVGAARPVIYGLAGYGEAGATRVLEMLKDEFKLSMALNGCPSVGDVTRDLITRSRL